MRLVRVKDLKTLPDEDRHFAPRSRFVWEIQRGDESAAGLIGLFYPSEMAEIPIIWFIPSATFTARDFRLMLLVRDIIKPLHPRAQALIDEENPRTARFAEALGFERIEKGIWLWQN
jgi:hypothetical protein